MNTNPTQFEAGSVEETIVWHRAEDGLPEHSKLVIALCVHKRIAADDGVAQWVGYFEQDEFWALGVGKIPSRDLRWTFWTEMPKGPMP